MRRKAKSENAVRITVIAGLLLLGLIIISDKIYRFFRHPSDLVLIDERQTETETSAVPVSEPLRKETTDTKIIQQASLALAGLPEGYTTERKSEESVQYGIFGSAAQNLTDFRNKNDIYHLKDMTLQIQEETVTAMNQLAEACMQETGNTNLLVYSTTLTYQTQGALYPDDLPDRNTGFCLDLAFLNEDGTISAVTSENDAWLRENAYRFGFIHSVPDAAYHFRYVGKLHASVMKEQDISFLEYLDELRNYSVAEPYQCCNDTTVWQMYFVPAAAFGSTDVPVPENKDYEISGNGKDGYLVLTFGNYE